MPVKQRVKALGSRTVKQVRERVGPGRPADAVADALTELLGATTRRPRTVYVLAASGVRRPVRDWLDRFPAGTVHVLADKESADWNLTERDARWHHAETIGQLNWQFKMHGSADVIVDLMPHDAAAQVEQWRHLFLHLHPRGVYIVDTSASTDAAFDPAWAETLNLIMSAGTEGAPPLPAGYAELSSSTAGVAVSRDAVVIHKRHQHLVKLGHAEANRMLLDREPGLTVTELRTLPAGVLTSRATTTSHEAGVEITALESSLPYPELHLRHYEGRVSLSAHSLAYLGDTVLPDSFRHHLAHTDNPRVRSVSATFGRIASGDRPHQHLEGAYYHLDSPFHGHYGHLTTEVISKLWGWDAAKAAIPDLKAFFQVRHGGEPDPSLERQFLTAYGIDPGDIVWTTAPTTVDSLVAATPMWHNQVPHYVHPQLADVWQRLATSLTDPDATTYERIFISRSGGLGNRKCRNTPEVEDWFRGHGFAIVYPEQLTLQAQAAVFGAARVVAGFGGSAMFNILFARQLETLIVLNHEAYTARNEHLFASVLGADEHYFWSTPDNPHPPGGWDGNSFMSGWEFDFARNAADLEALVKQL